MKAPHSFMLISIFLAIVVFLSNCDNVSSLSDEEGEFDTSIPMESQRFNLSDNATDAVIDVKFINRSDKNLYAAVPGAATLQKLDGNQWKDLGQWYSMLAIGPRSEKLAPGDTLGDGGSKLDIRSVVNNTDLIRSSGSYRIHFFIYRDKNYELFGEEGLIPETDRVSDPFKVIL